MYSVVQCAMLPLLLSTPSQKKKKSLKIQLSCCGTEIPKASFLTKTI